MNIFKSIWQWALNRRFKFQKSKPWKGEEDLPYPNTWNPDVSSETIEREIRDSLKKEKK